MPHFYVGISEKLFEYSPDKLSVFIGGTAGSVIKNLKRIEFNLRQQYLSYFLFELFYRLVIWIEAKGLSLFYFSGIVYQSPICF